MVTPLLLKPFGPKLMVTDEVILHFTPTIVELETPENLGRKNKSKNIDIPTIRL